MGCDCGKPKCDGHCGVSPAVLQINNPSECVLFHRVEVPASMGDSKTNPPKSGAYKNVLLYYEADQTSWLYSSDGVPQKLVNGITNYEDAINLPQINGVTLLGDKNSADLKLADAPMVITIASGNTSWSGADTAEDIYNFFLNQGKVNVAFEGSENYGYEIVSAAYIPGEQKMMCMTTVASVDPGSNPVDFSGNALYGLMTFYTAGKAVDVGELDLQLKLSITDFTGLNMTDGYVLEGVPATSFSIGMVKPGDGLSVSSDGTLTVIDHVFDTVADMKLSENLIAGSYAQTLGYHSANDGGGGLYKIREIVNTDVVDEGYIISLSDDNLVAELIVLDDRINIKQYGAYGDNTHDDTTAIQAAANFCNMNTATKYYVLDIPNGSYKITDPITFGRVYMEGHGRSSFRLNDNATLLFDHSVETFVKKIGVTGDENTHNSIGITFHTCSQLEVEEVFCGGCKIGMQLTDCDITNIERPTVQTCTETGIYLSGCTSINITEGDLYGNNTDFTYGGFNNDITIERNYLENSGDCIVADTTNGAATINTLNFQRNAVARNASTSASTIYTANARFINLVVSSNPIRLANANIKDNRFMFNNSATELININMNNSGTSYATFNFDNNAVSSDNSTMTHIVKGANIVMDANRINHGINHIGSMSYVSGTFGNYAYLTDDGSAKTYLTSLFGDYKVVVSSEETVTATSDGEVVTSIPYYKTNTSYVNIPIAVIDNNRPGWYARFVLKGTLSATNYTCQFTNTANGAGSGEYKFKVVYLEHN